MNKYKNLEPALVGYLKKEEAHPDQLLYFNWFLGKNPDFDEHCEETIAYLTTKLVKVSAEAILAWLRNSKVIADKRDKPFKVDNIMKGVLSRYYLFKWGKKYNLKFKLNPLAYDGTKGPVKLLTGIKMGLYNE